MKTLKLGLSESYKNKLNNEFGEDVGERLSEFLIKNPVCIELSAIMENINTPRIKILFHEIPDGEFLRTWQFEAQINGITQRYLKSLSLPKLDYSKNDILTVSMEYFCVNEKITEEECQQFVDGLVMDTQDLTKCSVCGEEQFETPSGLVCKNGHGGAPSV